MPIIVSVISLDIVNVFHKVLKCHSSLLKSELYFPVLVSTASHTSLEEKVSIKIKTLLRKFSVCKYPSKHLYTVGDFSFPFFFPYSLSLT